MDQIEKLVEGLNEQQKEAVTTTEGYVRVIAGAGSGKTRALTTRYAYIAEALGINSSNILCVTFTNKAAGEMRKRVKKIIGQDSDVSYIATYHGFCVRIIREECNKIQYPKDFIIMDTEDQKTVLRDIFNELGLTSKVFTHKQVLAYIGEQKKSLYYLDYLLGNGKSSSEKDQLAQVFYRYMDKQKRNFALDFDDLINVAIHILSNNKDVLEKWQKRLHYILVDETQDSSQRQFSLVNMLAGYHKNLFVVGDPDQTIYEWRGAAPEILVDFDKEFPDVKTIIMNENYRSTPNILTLGNTLIKKNKIRVDKDMVTQNSPGIDIVHYHGGNELEESTFVAKEIKKLVQEGKAKFSDFAILYRAGHVSRSIEQTFIKENIPYTIYGGIRFFERKEIKDTLSYLRLIEKGDDLSFLRIIGTPRRGLGKKYIENVARVAIDQDTTLLEALENNIHLASLNRQGAIEFVKMIKKFRTLRETLSVSDLIKEVLDRTGLTVMYRSEGDTDRLDNIKELQSSIIAMETEQQERIDLSEYLQEIALYTNMDIDTETDERVKLMTIHTSKGLEFPHVFLCGFTEGILPSTMSLKDRREKALEEERRLAYVAITRAEKSFYMTESEGYNFSTDSNKYPSRFLFEINEEHYIRKGVLNKELIEEAKEFLKHSNDNTVANKIFNKGDFVSHKIWGLGEIKEINENKGEYHIEFIDTGKIKPINFKFRGLTKIENSTELTAKEKIEKSKSDDALFALYPEVLKQTKNNIQANKLKGKTSSNSETKKKPPRKEKEETEILAEKKAKLEVEIIALQTEKEQRNRAKALKEKKKKKKKKAKKTSLWYKISQLLKN